MGDDPLRHPRRHVVQFSSGAGSAVAAKRVAEKYGTDNLFLLFADVNGEDPDNYRFLHEAHEWIGGELVIIDNDGKTIWDAFRQSRFLGNSRVDPCSRMLKREPIRAWMEQNCNPRRTVSYLGFDWLEMDRHERALPHWAPFQMQSPLMWEPMLDKSEVLTVLKFVGIEPPQLTRDGFPHANCGGGCVKAGIGQFAKLLEVRRPTFLEWEANEAGMREFLGKDIAILRDRRGVPTEVEVWKCMCGDGHLYADTPDDPCTNGEYVTAIRKVPANKPLTLTNLRLRLEGGDTLTDEEQTDMGACNCMTPPDDEEAAWFTA